MLSFLNHAKLFCSFRSESSRAINKHLMSTVSLQYLQDLASTETPEPANFTLLHHHHSDRQLWSLLSLLLKLSRKVKFLSFFFFFSLSILILLPSTQTRSDKGTPSSAVPSTPTTCLINEASQLNAAGKNCLAKAAFKIQHLWLLL